jgi:hypothetical protein
METTDTVASSTPSPKKSYSKILWIIGIVLALFGIDHYKLHYISGEEVEVKDSTIVVTPAVDTTNVKADTTKKVVVADTTKK